MDNPKFQTSRKDSFGTNALFETKVVYLFCMKVYVISVNCCTYTDTLDDIS